MMVEYIYWGHGLRLDLRGLAILGYFDFSLYNLNTILVVFIVWGYISLEVLGHCLWIWNELVWRILKLVGLGVTLGY